MGDASTYILLLSREIPKLFRSLFPPIGQLKN